MPFLDDLNAIGVLFAHLETIAPLDGLNGLVATPGPVKRLVHHGGLALDLAKGAKNGHKLFSKPAA